MLSDRILAVLSMALFVGFLGILAYYVSDPALWVVLAVVTLMGCYDFWAELRSGTGTDSSET